MSILEDWYLLRIESLALAARISALSGEAIAEAMERVAGEEKKTFDIGPSGHKIQVRFVNKKIKHTDDQLLDNLHAEIELEKAAAARANADAIAQIEKDLESLTKRLEHLKLTDTGRALQREYDERLEQLAEKVPVLALKGA